MMRKDIWIAAGCEAGLLLLAALLGHVLHAPLIFASLAPTVYEMVETPRQPSARPYNILVGHSVGLVAGLVAVTLTHSYSAPALSVHGLPMSRVFSVALAGFLTVVGTLLLRARQPAAVATALLVALGLMQTGPAILSIACAVLLMVVVGEPIRRLRLKHGQVRQSDCLGAGQIDR